jgi:sugar phosphate permease
MIGFSFTFGLMGAIYGGKPVSLLIETYSWHNVAITLAIISIIIGFSTYFVVRTPKKIEPLQEEQFKIINFTTILSSPII